MTPLLLTMMLAVTAPATPDYGEHEAERFVRCFYRGDSACVETWLNDHRDLSIFPDELVQMWAGATHMKGRLCEVETESDGNWIKVFARGVRGDEDFISGFLFVMKKGKVARIAFAESDRGAKCEGMK